MNWSLTRPCRDCPFRSDRPFYLHPAHAVEIATAEGTFACHKTLDYDTDEEPRETGETQHCAGFLIFRERQDQPSQMMRIAERLGMYDRHALDMSAPVYETLEAMLEGIAPKGKGKR